MPRRHALTVDRGAINQLEDLLALPTDEATLVRYRTLDAADLARIGRRRRDRNRLGFALQLCALRYPGRLLRRGEPIPAEALRFVADQVGAEPAALAAYAVRLQTRYQQLDAVREEFGFAEFTPPRRREILSWLLPVALAATSATSIAAALMDELRRRRLIVPGPFIIEQLVAAATVLAERHVAHQLTRSLSPAQAEALDALLVTRKGTSMSTLAWARQPPGAPGHRALARLIEQLACLRALALDPACAPNVSASSRARVPASRPSICGRCRPCAAVREAGPLPVAAPATAAAYLADRRVLLEQRLSEVAAKAAADKLEDVRIKGDELKISPLKAATPEEAAAERGAFRADRLYGVMPDVRITSLLAEVDRL